MRTIILATAIRLLIPVFQVFSLYILFRGHNHPGGGFIGGLIGSIGFILYVMTYGSKQTLKHYLKLTLIVGKEIDHYTRSRYNYHMQRVNAMHRRKLASEWKWEHRMMQIEPIYIIATGLLLAATSGFLGFFTQGPYMSSLWADFVIPVIGKPGTPILFDIGVYLLVLGIVLKITFVMSEE
ncbi:MnhB domain-containing protein [Pontibacter populi]|uniref:MnhB domain-containing protein n=1 Tax=Pontibacter populi TaxID=890055 RepID=A0ABV1RZ75_9BACT